MLSPHEIAPATTGVFRSMTGLHSEGFVAIMGGMYSLSYPGSHSGIQQNLET